MKDKLVVHISKTSLAGAPIRIVQALNKYTDYEARLINYMPSRLDDGNCIFDEDLDWQDKSIRDEARNLIKNADIIHLHHFMDLEFCNPFLINFLKETKNGCKFLRHYHSCKQYITKNEFDFQKFYPKDTLPSVIIPHCPERTFLNYPILPNILPIHDADYLPQKTNNKKLKVIYSVSNKASLKQERWDTKGYPEVSAILKNLSEKLNFEYVEIAKVPLKESLRIKQQSDIIIGDVVTGSYHLTELEALSLGKPSLTYLDGRSVMTFMNTFNTPEVPFVNVNYKNLDFVLKDLISNRSLRENIGKFSRKWIEKYYDDKILVQRFAETYDKLILGMKLVRDSMLEDDELKDFLYNKIYDYDWLKEIEQ